MERVATLLVSFTYNSDNGDIDMMIDLQSAKPLKI